MLAPHIIDMGDILWSVSFFGYRISGMRVQNDERFQFGDHTGTPARLIFEYGTSENLELSFPFLVESARRYIFSMLLNCNAKDRAIPAARQFVF